MKNKFASERGGVLLELIVFLFVLLTLAKSALEVHHALERRFGRILEERSTRIQQARS